ncbi:MAG: lipoate--protein ligase family protein [bacterium]|nr:lipoate--protein ligase family protein [bacterium]
MMWIPPKEWRWINDGVRSGSLHMAIDEVLTYHPYPTFRWYDWEKPTLSLGYHQNKNDLNWNHILQTGIDVCRRPTGGRAVFHQNVATYAIILPLNHKQEPTLWDLYQWIGEWWFKTLKSIHPNVQFYSEPITRPGAKFQSCFVSGNRYEIVIQRKKVMGSAQRRYQSAVLQHGSIRLKNPIVSAQYFFQSISKDEPIEESVATSLEEAWNLPITSMLLFEMLKEMFLSLGNEITESKLTETEIDTAHSIQKHFTIVRE